jgi:hypothetical protein
MLKLGRYRRLHHVAGSGGGSGAAAIFKMGGNLPAQADYVRDEIFVNLLHNVRAFAATTDPYSYTSVATDANGWPTVACALALPKRVPSVATVDYAFGADGDHHDATIGNASGFTWAVAPTYNAGTGRTTGVLRSPANDDGQNQPYITLQRAAQFIEINRPGFPADKTAALINPAWITWGKTIASWVRSMDWEATNHDISTTSFASEPTAATRHVSSQGKFPVSFAAQVAADMGNHGLWTCFKTMGVDQYFTDKATYLRDNVSALIELIVELGNELWNPSFKQFFAILAAVATEVDGWHGYDFGDGTNTRRIVSIVRTGNVLTVTTSAPHGYVANVTDLYVLSVGGLNGGPKRVTSTPTATTFTLADTGADSGNLVNGGSSVARLLNTDLNTWDGAYDFLGSLHPRWVARRVCQLSDRLRAVFGDAAMMTRCNPVLMVQVGNDASQHIAYVKNRLPNPLKHYVRAIGNGKYVFFNSAESPQPGITPVDLRNVDTYNGNTPVLVTDYQAVLADAVRGAKIGNVSDQLAINARLEDVEVWKYEVGFDANSVPLGQTNATTNHQKLTALFDAGAKNITKDFLREQMRLGVTRVGWYTMGAIDPAFTGEEQGWPIIDNLANASTSPRVQAIQEVLAEAHPGVQRNVVAATGTTVIDGRSTAGRFPTDWPNNATHTGASTDFNSGDPAWNITFAAAQTKTLTIRTIASDTGRSFTVWWNGVQVGGTITPTNGQTQDWAFTVTGTKDTNVLQLKKSGFVGTFIKVDDLNGLTFAP